MDLHQIVINHVIDRETKQSVTNLIGDCLHVVEASPGEYFVRCIYGGRKITVNEIQKILVGEVS